MGFTENFIQLRQAAENPTTQQLVQRAGQTNYLAKALDRARMNVAGQTLAGKTLSGRAGQVPGGQAGDAAQGKQQKPIYLLANQGTAQSGRKSALEAWQEQVDQDATERRRRALETAQRDQEAGYKRTQQLEAVYNPQAAERYSLDAGKKAQSAAELARSAAELRQRAEAISGEKERIGLVLSLPGYGRETMTGDQLRALEDERQRLEMQERTLNPQLTQQADELERQSSVLQWSAERNQVRADYLRWVQPYMALTRNADFAERSKYQTEQTGKDNGLFLDVVTMRESELVKWKNPLYEAINGNEAAAQALYGKAIATGRAADGEDRRIAQMTQQEKQIYNYLYNTRGLIQANKYYSELSPELNARASKKEAEWAEGLVQSGPLGAIAANVLSVAMAPAQGGAYLLQLADAIGTGQVDPNAGYNRLSQIPSAIREATGETINQTLGDTWGKWGNFGYQTLMSIADFLTTTAVSGGFGASAGAAEEWLNLGLMGTGAAADAVIAAMKRGVDTGAALVIGTVAGAAEMITEKISLETLMDPDLLADGKLRYILKNVLAEGSEEGASDLINFTADALYETLTHSGKSELETRIRALMEKGNTRPEATGIALGEKAEELGLSVLGGALSGGIMAGGAVGVQALRERGAENGGLLEGAETAQDAPEGAGGYDTRMETAPELAQLEAAQEAKNKGPRPDAEQAAPGLELRGEAAIADGAQTGIWDAQQTGQETRQATVAAPEETRYAGEVREDAATLADAVQKGAANESTRGSVSDGDPRRDAGIRAGEPAGSVGGSTEGRRAAAGQLRAASQRRAAGRDLRPVSARELGVKRGSETQNVRVLPQERWDAELTETGALIKKETGYEPVFVVGGMEFEKSDGSVGRARGILTGNRIIVQVDHSSITAQQIAAHEIWHALSRKAPAMRDAAEKKIREKYGPEEFDRVMDLYIQGLTGVIDVPTLDMRDQAFLRAMDRIREELLADAYAGINAFRADAGRFQAEATATKREFWEFPQAAENQTAAATERITGPPEEQYSVDDELAAEYQRRTDVQYRRKLMETNREEFNANEARRREIRKQIGKETSKRLEAEAVRQELDKLRDIDYQKRLLEIGGAEAIAENQKQVERLQDRLDRMEGRETGWERRQKQRRERRQAEAQRREQLRQEAEAKEDQRRKREAEAEEENRKRALQREEQRHQEELQRTERRRQEAKERREQAKGKPKKPVAESKPIIAKKDFRQQMLGLFSIPNGMRAEMGALADEFADLVLKQGSVAQKDIDDFFDRMYRAGVMTVQADEYARAGRSAVQGGHIYVSPSVKADFGENWNRFRIRAMAQGIYLTNDVNDRAADSWNAELAESFPGIFDADDLDQRDILERIVQLAEDGRDEKMSLAEYAAYLSGQEYITEDEILDNLERQVEWAISTFAKTARIELNLRERTGIKMAEEREKSRQAIQAEREKSWENRQADREENRARMLEERERSARAIQAEREKSWEQLKAERAREAQRREKERQQRREWAQKARERRELSELQQKTLKQLQWLSKNRDRAPAELRAVWDETLANIDIYAVSAANEMRWLPKYQDTLRNVVDMYKHAQANDPNFMPSKELDILVDRLEGDKLADMDLGALQDLYKAAVGLRTEFYNRNNVIQAAEHQQFSELFEGCKEELQAAAGKHDGLGDAFFNDLQLTPMNAMLRMSGWDKDSQWYSVAKMLEKGERDARRYEVNAKSMLAEFLQENKKWVKRADGQGKDAIWYEKEVPELLEFGKGDKPIFGDTVKVWMTPAQKVHLYLESQSYDNLRHMLGGRTFAKKELYAKGKRAEAFAEGTTIRLAPETVKALVADLTPEEKALADVLRRYYNEFSRGEINRVSNALYGFDKAISNNYAPIFTNDSYTKSEPGVFNLTAEGIGNLKARQYAKNPSYNIGAFDAFERSVQMSAKFVGMAIPVRNVSTLMNWQENGNSMRDVLNHAWGKKAVDLVDNLLLEIQGGREIKHEKLDAFINKVLSRYIRSVFGGNPSVMLKQFASYPLAAAYLGWRNMPIWVPGAAQVDRELIRRYTGQLAIREMGYAMTETAILKNNPGKLDDNEKINFMFGGGNIPWMDGFTVRCIWTWAENKVRNETNLQPGTQEQIDDGTDAFYKAVAAEFEETISRSQPMYDTMHRSEAMRSGGGLGRAFTLFKTVPQQEYNMLRETFGSAGAEMRKAAQAHSQLEALAKELTDADMDAETRARKEAALERAQAREKEARQAAKTAKRKAGNAVLGILLGNLMIGTITFLNAVAKHKIKKYYDDDEELTTESLMEELGKQYLKDSMGLVLGGDVAADILANIIFGDKWYEMDAPGISQINEIIQAGLTGGNAMVKLVQDSLEVLSSGGDLGKYLSAHGDVYINAVDKVVAALGTYAGGLPIENVKSYLLGAASWISPEVQIAYDDAMKQAKKAGLKGLSGGALELRITHLMDGHGVDLSDAAAETLAGLYEAGAKGAIPSDAPKSVTVDGEERAISLAEEQTWRKVWSGTVNAALDELLESNEFADADQAAKEKMLKRLYDCATEAAKIRLWADYGMNSTMEGMEAITGTGISLAEWDIIAQRRAELEATEGIGASMRATEFAQWVDERQYTAGQAAVIKDRMGFYSAARAEAGRYEALTAAGLSTGQAGDLARALAALEPEDGKESVSDMQRYRLIEQSDMSDAEKLAAIGTIMGTEEAKDDGSKTEWAKMTGMLDKGVKLAQYLDLKDAGVVDRYQRVLDVGGYGIEPAAYIAWRKKLPAFDADGNGSYTQAEIQRALQSMAGGGLLLAGQTVPEITLTKRQMAALWQAENKSWKPKNNPFDVTVGQQVYDALNQKQTATGSGLKLLGPGA